MTNRQRRSSETKATYSGRPVAKLEPEAVQRPVILTLRSEKDEIIPPWGTKEREDFNYLLADWVDLLDEAISIVGQKIASLSFSVDGPGRTARKWRDILVRGWTVETQKWVKEVLRNDKGGYCQVVRYCPSWAVNEDGRLSERGLAALKDGKDEGWEVAYIAALDSRQCMPTGNLEYPVVYRPSGGGDALRLAAHQVLVLIDSPVADVKKPGWGKCSVSRCIQTAALRGEISQYFREAFGDKPKSGLVFVNNVLMPDYEEMLKALETEQSGKRLVYYRGMLLISSAEHTEPVGVQTIPFRIAPEGWVQRDTYQECKEVIATAFGLDPLEFGPIGSVGLGSAEQSTEMAKKAKGKLLALLMEGIEREIAQKVLPANCEFSFISHDVEEEMEEARLADQHAKTVRSLWEPTPATGTGLITEDEGRQMLADEQVIPQEFIEQDVTGAEEIEDTEAEQTTETLVKALREGRVIPLRRIPIPGVRRIAVKQRASSSERRTNEYTDELRRVYEDWAEEAADKLEAVEEEDREALLVALLALLATRLKAAGRQGLYAAFERGLADGAPEGEALAQLERTIAENDRHIQELVDQAGARFREDAGQPGFAWEKVTLGATLAALAWRTLRYGGVFWAMLGLGALQRFDRNAPYLWELDPQAKHCVDCPAYVGEYDNREQMLQRTGGLPGEVGVSECDGNCRCRLYTQVGGQWVPVIA